MKTIWAVGLFFLAAVLVAFCLYAPSIHNEFVWDDPIVLGQQLNAFQSYAKAFFPPPRIPQFGRLYYRPLITLSYLIDLDLWGESPIGFHLPVVVFHAINAGLVFLVGRRLFGAHSMGPLAALASALLFAAHPIHTESVCWMAGRSDTLATLFLLPALLAWLAWRRSGAWPWLVACSACFLASCFAKESALAFPMIVLLGEVVGAADWTGRPDGPAQPERPAARRSDGPPAGKDSGRDRRRRRRQQQRRPDAPAQAPAPSLALGMAALAAAGGVYFSMRHAALAVEPTPLQMQHRGEW